MSVLAFSCTHAPFHHSNALDFLNDVKRLIKPKLVVMLGDLGDQHGWSRHGRAPDAPGQADEDKKTLRFCRSLYKLFPHALACIGNHDERVAKLAARVGLPSRLHLTLHQIYECPASWRWAQSHVVRGVVYMHGTGYSGENPALRAAKNNRKSTVIGHTHSQAGVRYHCNGFDCLWAMSVGCLVDPQSIAMAYGKENKDKPILGCGVIEDDPHFIPMKV